MAPKALEIYQGKDGDKLLHALRSIFGKLQVGGLPQPTSSGYAQEVFSGHDSKKKAPVISGAFIYTNQTSA